MDSTETLVIIAGIATLLVERLFSWLRKIRKSKCCGAEFEMAQSTEGLPGNDTNV